MARESSETLALAAGYMLVETEHKGFAVSAHG
jgi:hypothetical protein